MHTSSKKCRVCKEQFEPRSSLQFACSTACAIDYAQKKGDREFKAQTRKMKESIKSKSDWLKEAQIEFNKFIRMRDAGNPCISCGRSSGCKVNAGHYKSVGACPELRFNEDNCNLQCEHCNCYNSGNAIGYRLGLVEKIGTERVEKLEGPQEPARYTIEEIKEIKQFYKDKFKQL